VHGRAQFIRWSVRTFLEDKEQGYKKRNQLRYQVPSPPDPTRPTKRMRRWPTTKQSDRDHQPESQSMRLYPRIPIRVAQGTADIMTANSAHTIGNIALLHRRQQVALIPTATRRRGRGRMPLPQATRTRAIPRTAPLVLRGRASSRDHGTIWRLAARIGA
jgi:hypothetical protein